MIYRGSQKVNKIYVGSREVNSVYRGSDLVYSKSRLPAGYTELEYIEASGAQYINTGFRPTYLSTIEIEAMTSSSGAVEANPLFGARISAGSYQYRCFLLWFNTPTCKASVGTTEFTTPVQLANEAGVYHRVVLGRYSAAADGGIVGIDGEETAYSLRGYHWAGSSASPELYIGMINGVSGKFFSGRIKECRLYSGEELAREFVPCRRKADGAVGMYDLCGSASPFDGSPFYGNSGTGSFAAE